MVGAGGAGADKAPITRLILAEQRLQLCEAYLLAALVEPARGLLRVELGWNMWGRRGEKVVAHALLRGPCEHGGLMPANVHGLEEMEAERKRMLQERLGHRSLTDAFKERKERETKKLAKMSWRDRAMTATNGHLDAYTGEKIPVYLQGF